MRLPGVPGTEVIGRAGGVPVLIMTSYASVRSAVEAMKLGAVDYIAKPFDHEELLIQVRRILKQRQPQAAAQAAEESDVDRNCAGKGHGGPQPGHGGGVPAHRQGGPHRLHGADPGRIRYRQGAGGAGGARAEPAPGAPFVTVNCAAIPRP